MNVDSFKMPSTTNYVQNFYCSLVIKPIIRILSTVGQNRDYLPILSFRVSECIIHLRVIDTNSPNIIKIL